MPNLVSSIIPDPDRGFYTPNVMGINGNDLYIDSPPDGVLQLNGTVETTAGSDIVTGTGTSFTSENIVPRDSIKIGNEERFIESINSDTQITVSQTFSESLAGVNIYKVIDSVAKEWCYNSVLFYMPDTNKAISNPEKTESDYENILSFWSNIFLMLSAGSPGDIFNPGVNRQGWIYHINLGWCYVVPKPSIDSTYAPIWIWIHEISDWFYFTRGSILNTWAFLESYIDPIPSNSTEPIYGSQQLLKQDGTSLRVTTTANSNIVTCEEGVSFSSSGLGAGDIIKIVSEKAYVESIDFHLINGYTVQTTAGSPIVQTSGDMTGVLSNGDTVKIDNIEYTISNLTSAAFNLNSNASVSGVKFSIYIKAENELRLRSNFSTTYSTAQNIYKETEIRDIDKPAEYGVMLWSDGLQQYRSFIVNSEGHIYMSNEQPIGTPRVIKYTKKNLFPVT